MLIACVDGLSGFPDAINTAFPDAKIQLCIIHMVRNSMKYVVWKDYKAIASGLKLIYQSSTEEIARSELDSFAQIWDEKYPQISRSWNNYWPTNLVTFFDYSKKVKQLRERRDFLKKDIRKAIYTTNVIESLNSVIHKSVKTRKLFPNNDLEPISFLKSASVKSC